MGLSYLRVLAKHVQKRAKIFRRRDLEPDLLIRHVFEGQALGMERQPINQGPFLAIGGTIAAFEIAEINARAPLRRRRVVKGIDRQGQANMLEVDADLMGFAGFWETADEGEVAEGFSERPY